MRLGLLFVLGFFTLNLVGQAVQEDFGSLADGTNISTSNTNFDYVRSGSGGSIVASSPNCFSGGSGSTMTLGGSTGGSLTGVGVQSSLGGGSFYGMEFRLQGSNLISGDIFIGAGSGSMFTGNSTFSTADLFLGLQIDNGNFEYRDSGWKNMGFSFQNNTEYFIELAANGTGNTLNYEYQGSMLSIADGTMDVRVNGVLVGDDLPIEDNQNVTGFRLYQVDGGATVCLDDFLIYTDENDLAELLPVELTKFNASAVNNSVSLEWATAQEENNSHFSIQRSQDGRRFTEIGTVDGVGNSSVQQNYQFMDRSPASGMNYYRLVQVDYDGASETYGPLAVEMKRETGSTPTIYPNPATSSITISSELADDTQLTLLNVTGQVVTTAQFGQTKTGNLGNLDVSQLKNGVYFLRFENGNYSETVRFVKQ